METDQAPKPGNLSPESTWETIEWLQTGLFQVFQTQRKGRWQTGLQLASRLLERGFQVPWLGLLEDLGLWFLENEAVRPAILPGGIPAKWLRPYRDKVVGRWVVDPLARKLKAVLAGFTADEATICLAWLVSQWLEEKTILGRLLVPSQLQTLLQQPQAKLDSIAFNKVWPDRPDNTQANEILQSIEGFSCQTRSFTVQQIEFIESGKALLTLGQNSGLTLLLKARAKLFPNPSLPLPPVPSSSEEVETLQFTEEDYPTGGYSSITNKGRFESLLPSQLAYWDYPVGETDLFSWKFSRDELWFYSRDENALRQPQLEVIFLFREGFEAQKNYDSRWGFQSLTLLVATFLEVAYLLERDRPHHGLKIRWIFEASSGVQNSGDGNSELSRLLGVLLALRIREGSHLVEIKDRAQISVELQKRSGPKRIRILECNSNDHFLENGESFSTEWLGLSLEGTDFLLFQKQKNQPHSSMSSSSFQELGFLLLNWIVRAAMPDDFEAIRSFSKTVR